MKTENVICGQSRQDVRLEFHWRFLQKSLRRIIIKFLSKQKKQVSRYV